ncbi:MAG: flagellar basal body P-ring formation chaperone FlgA [Candidatus Electryonea clarkiae]|nr:flagellar basal body P-ring formation chaperone FlgA [Candidatus Electryonea clarkiae]MDP8285179.1 flagellar basal body P-ring formation chaperone FlgA [Candidatus Electryonea clarkiae]
MFSGTSTASSTVFPEKVSLAINNYLESVWGAGNVVWVPGSARILSSLTEEVELDVVPCGKPRGSTLINLDLRKNGKLIRRLPVSIRVIAFAWVPVAAEEMDSRQALDIGSIEWEKREVTKISIDWMDKPEESNNDIWWSKRKIHKGDILTLDKVEKRPDVVRGDTVTLLSISRGVTVKTGGIALRNGNIGDNIKVENLENGVRLRGTVENQGVVLAEGIDRRKVR